MKNLIDYAYQDNGTEFRAELYAAIHDKVAAHIEAKKQEIASGLMGQQSEEVELEEDAGAYETWDPKHPHFVKNYKKYQSDNANQGSIKDFIEKEKARPKRLPEEVEALDESLINSYKEHASFSDKLHHLNDIHKKLSNAGYKTTDKLDPKAENSPVTYHKAGAGSIQVSHGGASGTSPQEKAGWSAPPIFTSVKKFGMSNAPRT